MVSGVIGAGGVSLDSLVADWVEEGKQLIHKEICTDYNEHKSENRKC